MSSDSGNKTDDNSIEKSPHSPYHSHGHQHHGHSLKHLFRPDGRKVHIAPSPDVAEQLHKSLSREEKEFDIYIHGSPEHLNLLREIHAHHESRQDNLRQQHGSIYDEFENVRLELDVLSAELHRLTEHGVSLDANFEKVRRTLSPIDDSWSKPRTSQLIFLGTSFSSSKATAAMVNPFGYSARLRTRDPNSPGSSSLHVDHSTTHEPRDWSAERQNGSVLQVWKRPVLRQFMHKGLLWRASEIEEVASFELFFDLLYVGILAINGDQAAEDPTGLSLLRFSVTFILSWKLWSDLTMIISWFETDDILQRVSVLFFMACLLGFTTNITHSMDTTYSQMLAFYLAQRLFTAIYYAWIAYLIPMVKGIMAGNATLITIAAALWISSIHVSWTSRLIFIWITIPFELLSPFLFVVFIRPSTANGPLRRISKYFEYYPAINIEHKTERTNAFVTLVLGYSVVSLLYQNRASMGINAFFGKAVLGLIQAFSYNWMYFELDSFNLHYHAIRRHVHSSMIWTAVHLPFVMSFTLAGAALSRLVLLHDCANTDPETLSESSFEKSEPDLHIGLRWYYSTGLGIALASMALISLCHIHKEIKNQRLKKRYRLTLRFGVALILILLPLAHSLNSLQLIATTTGLVVFSLLIELYGSTCIGEGFDFLRSERRCRKKCERMRYYGECKMKRADVERCVKTGAVVNVEELSRGERRQGFCEAC
ncbi:MAG: hypothetical protein M1834_002856 [Cirrosporium novae-zelandiae]|nr:MAG: hypothetical protein M1834_002856 [Cirrosporium novae-zelandiae]